MTHQTREHPFEQFLQAFTRQGPPVRPLQVLQHPLLAFRIDEADAAGLLVTLQPCDEP